MPLLRDRRPSQKKGVEEQIQRGREEGALGLERHGKATYQMGPDRTPPAEGEGDREEEKQRDRTVRQLTEYAHPVPGARSVCAWLRVKWRGVVAGFIDRIWIKNGCWHWSASLLRELGT